MQQKILSAYTIVKALAEQSRRRKYLPLLLVELGALPDHHALHLCSKAASEHKEFLEVLLADGLISSEQGDVIRTAWMESGPQLGRVLIDMDFIDARTCTNALENFEIIKESEREIKATAERRRLKAQQQAAAVVSEAVAAAVAVAETKETEETANAT